MRTNYFHLTPTENVSKILQDGLRADEDGNIFTFTDMLVANTIAKDQVFTEHYSIFKIDRSGITGAIEKDNVAEFSAPFHRIIKQEYIKPKFLKLICEQDTVFFKPTTWDYLIGARFWGLTGEQVDKKFKRLKKSYREYIKHDRGVGAA